MELSVFGFNINTNMDIKFTPSVLSHPELPLISIEVVENLCIPDNITLFESNSMVSCYFGENIYVLNASNNELIVVTPSRVLVRPGTEYYVDLSEFNACFGPGLLLLSRLHKRAIVHGSAFLYNNKAYLVIAPSGIGKSTFCAAMSVYHNTPCIADDILVISTDGKYVYTGIPVINLNQDVLLSMGRTDKQYFTDHPEPGVKYRYEQCDVKLTESLHKYEIGGLVFLDTPLESENDILAISPVDSTTQFLKLFRNVKLKKSLNKQALVNEIAVLQSINNTQLSINVRLKRSLPLLDEQMKQILLMINNCS